MRMRTRVLCLLLLTQLWTTTLSTPNILYKTNANRLQTTYTQLETGSLLSCAAECNKNESCNSVNYQATTRLCELSELALMHVDANRHSSTGWATYSRSGTQDWILMFQAIPDVGTDPYVAWTIGTNVTTNDVNCMGSDVTLCPMHFRSALVDLWHMFGNFEVKVSLWKDQAEAAYITFDGTDSNLDDWFSRERLLSSTWTVLEDPTVNMNRFSMEGVSKRRFYISRSWAGCPYDKAVLIVKIAEAICAYDIHPSYPRFLYSSSNTWATFYNAANFDFADSLRISVRLL